MNLWKKFLYKIQNKPIPKEPERNDNNIATAQEFYYARKISPSECIVEKDRFIQSKIWPSERYQDVWGYECDRWDVIDENGIETGDWCEKKELYTSELGAIKSVVNFHKARLDNNTTITTEIQKTLYQWETKERNFQQADSQ